MPYIIYNIRNILVFLNPKLQCLNMSNQTLNLRRLNAVFLMILMNEDHDSGASSLFLLFSLSTRWWKSV